MVPGRKFCTSTSACATSLARTSRPAALFTSIASERLPRLEEMNSAENSPALSMVARLRRVISPPIGSILSTSAPWSARNMVANGPETTPVKSSTRTPLSGPGMTFSLGCVPHQGTIIHIVVRPAYFQPLVAGGARDLSGCFGHGASGLLYNRFLDVADLIFAEEHFLSDEEGRRTKCPAVDRVGRQIDQPLLDVILLRARDQPFDIDARCGEGSAENLEIVHLFGFFPHVMIGGAEIGLEHSLKLSRDGAPHQHQRID